MNGDTDITPNESRCQEPNTFVIPGELYSSKNSRRPLMYQDRSGKKIIKVVKSNAARKHETELSRLLQNQPGFCERMRNEIAQCTLPLRMEITIYRRTHQRFDYNNITQNLFDCLVKMGILEDDNAAILLPVYIPFKVDHDQPRTELRFL